MIRCVIFDFDLTLFDSTDLKAQMDAGDWQSVYAGIADGSVYPGVHDVLDRLRRAGIHIAIVTNSPRTYVEKALAAHGLSVDFIVAYHDMQSPKPDSNCMFQIFKHFRVDKYECVYIGDNEIDRQTAVNAKVPFYGVAWGNFNDDVVRLRFETLTQTIFQVGGDDPLALRSLDNHYFLGIYDSKEKGACVKGKVLEVKDGKAEAIAQWKQAIVRTAAQLPEIDYVVRAYGHKETTLVKGSLDTLCECICTETASRYVPQLIRKTRVTRQSAGLSPSERKKKVDGLYHVGDIEGLSLRNKIVLIVDDVLTTGATTTEITNTLYEIDPSIRVVVFTLVKTRFSQSVSANTALDAEYRQLNSRLMRYLQYAELLRGADIAQSNTQRISKPFSANYAHTSHNFDIHNLRRDSIKSNALRLQYLPAIFILKNLLQRGKPSLPSRFLRAHLGDLHLNEDFGTALPLFDCDNADLTVKCMGTLHSSASDYFYRRIIPKYFGDCSFVQSLFIVNRRLIDIIPHGQLASPNTRVDFFLPQAGLVVLIDPAGGFELKQVLKEFRLRGLKAVLLSSIDIENETDRLEGGIGEIVGHLHQVLALGQVYKSTSPASLTLSDYQARYLKQAIFPDNARQYTAIIRLQILLLELLDNGTLGFEGHWDFEIRSHDVQDILPLAVDDTLIWLTHILALQNIPFDPPTYKVTRIDVDEDFSNKGDAIKIDTSLYQRAYDATLLADDVIAIRTQTMEALVTISSSARDNAPVMTVEAVDHFIMSTTDPISYVINLGEQHQHVKSLRFLLENIFLANDNNVNFRPGQLGIIASALMRNDTIGLLPTGSGKSVCYQMAAVLQPCISFVVCPIKSLMYDQKLDLDNILFSRTHYITGDQSPKEKARVQNNFAQGKYFFVFISPERFQIQAFRNDLKNINLERSFAYAVIDEVHCLSEWGHDFRTSYLNLANTIATYAPGASYIGLTATASVNVLKDIQTEFSVLDSHVKTPPDFSRKELEFHAINDAGDKRGALKKALHALRQPTENEFDFTYNDSDCGIVFTPHVNGSKGCFPIAEDLTRTLGERVEFYSGSKPTQWAKDQNFDDYKMAVQRGFKENKFRLLAATKAFGMGVNKGNVAYTIHYGIPGSMEALYQEAGRAGRDVSLFQDRKAQCLVLLGVEKNEDALAEVWSPSATFMQLKKLNDQKLSNSDISTNLFLFLQGSDPVNAEYRLMETIYNKHYQIGKLDQIVYAKRLESQANKVQKAIFRLTQLGIIRDWTVENFITGVYRVQFVENDIETICENLHRTVKKYDADFSIDAWQSKGAENVTLLGDLQSRGKLSKVGYYFCLLLLWSYEHFAYNRRQSLKNVYDKCRSLASAEISGEQFKFELEGYFRFNESSDTLRIIADNPSDHSRWFDVFYTTVDGIRTRDVVTLNELATLKEQNSRFLESYMDNVALDLISGITRLVVGEFNDADGRNRYIASLKKIRHYDANDITLIVREICAVVNAFKCDTPSKNAMVSATHEALDNLSMMYEVNEKLDDDVSVNLIIHNNLARLRQLNTENRTVKWSIN